MPGARSVQSAAERLAPVQTKSGLREGEESPEWPAQVAVEDLRFLLEKQLDLDHLWIDNVGRWRASKGE